MRMAKDEGWDTVLCASEDERDILSDAILNCSGSLMGYEDGGITLKADRWLKDNEELSFAGFSIQCIKTPGHTEGSMSFFLPENRMLVCGDTVFEGSVGRTDLPTGSMSTLIRSIKEKLFILPDETKLYPGHGDSTTVGHEKNYNPFCG